MMVFDKQANTVTFELDKRFEFDAIRKCLESTGREMYSHSPERWIEGFKALFPVMDKAYQHKETPPGRYAFSDVFLFFFPQLSREQANLLANDLRHGIIHDNMARDCASLVSKWDAKTFNKDVFRFDSNDQHATINVRLFYAFVRMKLFDTYDEKDEDPEMDLVMDGIMKNGVHLFVLTEAGFYPLSRILVNGEEGLNEFLKQLLSNDPFPQFVLSKRKQDV